jgi:murein DD-endopeptidase MepM/ murein hydrolase activator NlpD
LSTVKGAIHRAPTLLRYVPMKRFIILITLLLLTLSFVNAQDNEATETLSVPPAPNRTIEGDGFAIDLYFGSLQQGRAGLIGLRGDGVTRAQATIFNRRVDFFTVPDRDGLYALIAANIDQPLRVYELVIAVELANNSTPQNLSIAVDVTNGGFISGEVTLPPDDKLIALLDPQIENDELTLLFETAAPVTEVVYWGREGFIPPINAELTSPFGAVRIFNDSYQSIHTGWDFQATIGQPMVASASGRVVLEGHIPLRGNYILIDHGRGVYSGYAHLSVSYVTTGQAVTTGQLLGLVGTTGRSSSAHAHFEFIVNGEWVDAADFIQMYIP